MMRARETEYRRPAGVGSDRPMAGGNGETVR
jgi:hypothetical protein